MSFGLEVMDSEGREVFAVGRKYFVIVGEIYIASGSVSGGSTITHTRQIPNVLPEGEKVFVIGSAIAQPAFYRVNGLTLTINPPQSYAWQTGRTSYKAVKLFYGYYA